MTIERKGVLVRDLLPDDKTDRGTVDKIETNGETTVITFRWTKDTLALWSDDLNRELTDLRRSL